MKVLFVCLGNICRSPAAEGIFLKMVKEAKLEQKISVDSAGTGGWHVGDGPDNRMIAHAKQRGYDLSQLEARQIAKVDFEKFDYILTMDNSNYAQVLSMDSSGKFHSRVHKMVSYCKVHDVAEVPDPYHRAADGFELVLDILEDSCAELLLKIKGALT